MSGCIWEWMHVQWEEQARMIFIPGRARLPLVFPFHCTVGQAAMLPVLCSVFPWHSFWLTWLDLTNHPIFGFHVFIWFHCNMFDDSAWENWIYQYLLFDFYFKRMCTSASLSNLCLPPLYDFFLFCSVGYHYVNVYFPPSCFQPVFCNAVHYNSSLTAVTFHYNSLVLWGSGVVDTWIVPWTHHLFDHNNDTF